MTFAAVCICGVCVLLVGLFAWGNRDEVLPKRGRAKVVVTLKTGSSFRGVLWEHDRQVLVLRQTEALTGESPIVVDGELLVFRSEVEYLQKP